MLPRRRSCLNGDRYREQHGFEGRLCDCLITWTDQGTSLAAAIELKSGSFDAGKVCEQLQSGANLIAEMAPDVTHREFFPILAAGRPTSEERRAVNRCSVDFRGKAVKVIVARCGETLAEVVRKARE